MDAEIVGLLARWTLYFIIYGVIGYLVEIIYCYVQTGGELKNRGFLYGPVVPIYAVGTLLIVLATNWLGWPWWANFFVVILICDTLEYCTSLFLEKIFHMRWWDYAKSTRWHLNGRISLRTSVGFGLGGLIIIYALHPVIINLVELLPGGIMVILAALLLGIYIMDTVLSVITAFKVKGMLGRGNIDATAPIKKFAAHYYKDAKRSKKRKKA